MVCFNNCASKAPIRQHGAVSKQPLQAPHKVKLTNKIISSIIIITAPPKHQYGGMEVVSSSRACAIQGYAHPRVSRFLLEIIKQNKKYGWDAHGIRSAQARTSTKLILG